MKYLVCFFLFLLIHTSVFTQDKPTKQNIGDEPYPAPVMYNNLSAEEARLIGQFENKETSNLHIYANPKQDNNYFFKGKPLTSDFSKFLNGKLASQTWIKGKEPQAVFSLRGEAEELYIIYMPGDEWNNEVSLFDMENGKLKKRMVLAEYRCKNQRCEQVDSWLQDVNGDTRLDIIQKTKKTKKNGTVKIKPTIYLMDQNGNFKKSNYDRIEINDYQMENLW